MPDDRHRQPPRPRIQVRGLRKSYGKQVVLDGIDLDVPEGTVFALLGPNGAGKTTVDPHPLDADRGRRRRGPDRRASTSRASPNAVRGLIGLTGQVSAVDGQFTGEENLRLMADLHHLGQGARAGAGSPSCSSGSTSSTTPPSPR